MPDLSKLLLLIQAAPAQSGVIYCQSRKDADSLASQFCEAGIVAAPYHSGLTAEERAQVQDDFRHRRISVVCASISFHVRKARQQPVEPKAEATADPKDGQPATTAGTEKTAEAAPKARASRDYITLQGTQYHIGEGLYPVFPWRNAVDQLAKRVYFNLWEDSDVPVSDFVPADAERRNEVAPLFVQIATQAFGLRASADGTQLHIPLRIELDCDGHPVHTLQAASNDDALQQFHTFLETQQHFPFSGADEYECSLRRWYHEVTHGRILLNPTQQLCLDALLDKYQLLPKARPRTAQQTTK